MRPCYLTDLIDLTEPSDLTTPMILPFFRSLRALPNQSPRAALTLSPMLPVLMSLMWLVLSAAAGSVVAATQPQGGSVAPLPSAGRSTAREAPLPELTYRVTPQWQASPRHFVIEAVLPAAPGRETVVDLPDQFGASRTLHANLRNLSSADAGVEILPGARPAQRILRHPPMQQIRLRYEVLARSQGRLDHSTFFEPLLEADHFHVLGHALFATPAFIEDGTDLRWSVTWAGLPESWSLAGSHGVKQGAETTWSKARGRAGQFQHALYVGGDFRLHEVKVEGRPLRFALRGSWPFPDSQFVGEAQKLIAQHRAFWNDFDFPDYFISLIPSDVERGSSGGTALTNAFAMHVSRDFTVPGQAFEFLIGHEHLHTWVPQRFGAMGKDEALRYWFSEGFTNYLTHRLLVKAGLWTPQRYAQSINEVIRKYLNSNARTFDNRQVADNFWKTREAGDMPYQRGELLALRWNAALVRQGSSLDAVLKSLMQPAGGETLATERLSDALARRIASVPDDIARFIEKGEEAELTADLLGPCFELRQEPLKLYEPGFDVQASIKDRKLTGVVQESAAWKAGLREGQKVLALNISYGDLNTPVKITIEGEGGAPQTLDFLPARDTGRKIPQYFMRAAGVDGAACRGWF